MTNLTGRAPSQTYPGLLTLDNNGQGLSAVLETVQDGIGQNSPLQLSLTQVNITALVPTFNSTGAIQLPSGTTAQRPAPPSNGMIRYNNTTNQLEAFINGMWQALETGGIANNLQIQVTQAAHGFIVGNVLRLNLAVYVLAQADNVADAEAIGIVVGVIDVNNFILQFGGYVTGLAGLIAGTVYFLSTGVAGALTATRTVVPGTVVKPLLVADTTTSGFWVNQLGQLL